MPHRAAAPSPRTPSPAPLRAPSPTSAPARRSGLDPEGGRWGLKPGRNGVEGGRTGPVFNPDTNNERRFQPRLGFKSGHFIPAGLEPVPGRIWSNRTRPYWATTAGSWLGFCRVPCFAGVAGLRPRHRPSAVCDRTIRSGPDGRHRPVRSQKKKDAAPHTRLTGTHVPGTSGAGGPVGRPMGCCRLAGC